MTIVNSSKAFSLVLPELIFGCGTIKKLPEILKDYKVKKVSLLTDEGIIKSGIAEKVSSIIKDSGVECEIFSDVEADPTLENVKDAYNTCDKNTELLIGLGGGSPIDTAKIVSVMLKYKGDLEEYLGLDQVPGRGLPTIFIPTTSGTGSEVTKYCILSDKKEEIKKGIVSDYIIPDYAIVDPELTVTMPPKITASTGIDALIHAIEGYISPRANPITDLLALEAINMIYFNLPISCADGSDLNARTNMAYASMTAGIVLNGTGAGASHALAYPITSKYNLPHGDGCMLTFLELLEFFVLSNVDKYRKMAEAVGVNTENMSCREAGMKGVEEIRRFAEYIDVPTTLSEVNMDKNDVKPFAENVYKTQQRLLVNAPKEMSVEDIMEIYKKSY